MPLISDSEEHILAQIGTYDLCRIYCFGNLSRASGGLSKLSFEEVMMWLHGQRSELHVELLHPQLKRALD